METSDNPFLLEEQFDPEDEYRPEPEPEPLPPFWTDGSPRIGIHTSIAGSYINALESAKKLGANALQIFSASPRMWQGAVKIAETDAQAFRAKREELQLGPLVIHANYLINLAAVQPMLRTRSIQAFHEELVRARWLRFFTAGTTARSSVLREKSLKVRTPRSHSITL